MFEFFQSQGHSETPIFLLYEKNWGYEFCGFMVGLNTDTPSFESDDLRPKQPQHSEW